MNNNIILNILYLHENSIDNKTKQYKSAHTGQK